MSRLLASCLLTALALSSVVSSHACGRLLKSELDVLLREGSGRVLGIALGALDSGKGPRAVGSSEPDGESECVAVSVGANLNASIWISSSPLFSAGDPGQMRIEFGSSETCDARSARAFDSQELARLSLMSTEDIGGVLSDWSGTSGYGCTSGKEDEVVPRGDDRLVAMLSRPDAKCFSKTISLVRDGDELERIVEVAVASGAEGHPSVWVSINEVW